MAINDFGAEQAQNYERKVPVVLVIDTSGSMSGAKIDEVNQHFPVFEADVLADSVAKQRADVAIVTFDSEVVVRREFGLLGDDPLPTFTAQGSTKLVDGVRKAIALIKERIDWYFATGQDCYRPYLLIITDGEPDGDQDVAGLRDELKNLATVGYDSPKKPGHPRKINIMAFGVEGASPDALAQFSPTAPLFFKSTSFKDFFKYLATVTRQVSRSKEGGKLNISPGALGVADPFQVTS